jgi:hypothetical protein
MGGSCLSVCVSTQVNRSGFQARLLEPVICTEPVLHSEWQLRSPIRSIPVKGSVSEELKFRRRRDRKSKGNTGPRAAVASTIQAFEVLPAEGCSWYPECVDHSAGFLARDPGVFHWRMINQARGIVSGPAAVPDYQGLSAGELREKKKLISGKCDQGASPVDFWQGDDDQADVAGDPDRPSFNPDTPQTFKRGRKRYETDEEDFQKREAWEVTRAKCEAILKAGKAWSPLDPAEDTRIHSNGARYNISNPLFKRIEYELRVHWEDFDSRKKLYAELGLEWETERKKELEDINMKKEMPTTKFTKAQIKDMATHSEPIVYVHVALDHPRWYRLDIGNLETYAEAIERVKQKVLAEALDKAGVPKRTTDHRTHEGHPELSRAFKEVVVRINEAFSRENIYILDRRSPITVAVAEQEWEAD